MNQRGRHERGGKRQDATDAEIDATRQDHEGHAQGDDSDQRNLPQNIGEIAQLKKDARVTIDLKNVSFVDRDGIALLKSLRDHRVEILNALPFIAEQIETEDKL